MEKLKNSVWMEVTAGGCLLSDVILFAILDGSYYKKISKMYTMNLWFNIETCNKYWASLSLCQSSIWTWCWLKMNTMAPPFNIEACNKHQKKHQIWVNLQHVVSHLGSHFGWQPLPKISQMNTMAPIFKIESCNIYRTPLHESPIINRA